MNTPFDKWNEQKKRVNKFAPTKVKVGNIYWVSIGYNIGHEVYGKSISFTRPVLVLKVLSNKLFLGVPLSSQTKHRDKAYHYAFFDNNNTEQVALLHQIRTFDTRRSQGKIANVQNETLEIIKDKIKSEIL